MITELRLLKVGKEEFKLLFLNPINILQSDFDESLEESWHIVHYLITGQKWESLSPLKEAIVMGLPFPNPPTGPEVFNLNFLMGKNLMNLIEALEKIDEDKVIDQFSLEMAIENQILIPSYFEDELEEEVEQKAYLRNELNKLVRFYKSVDPKKDVVIKYLGS